jgi:hypothetical protein
MGAGGVAGAFSAKRTFDLGWLQPSQIAVNTRGQIRLAPYGTPGAVTAAFIGDGNGGEVWIEYRANTAGGGQVQLRWSQAEPKPRSIEAASTVLLDLTPGSGGVTDTFQALARSFGDAGVSTVGSNVAVIGDLAITLISRDPTGATIDISGGDASLQRYRSSWLSITQIGKTLDVSWVSHPSARIVGLSEYIVEIVAADGAVIRTTTTTSDSVEIATPAAGRYVMRVTPVFRSGVGTPDSLAFVRSKSGSIELYPLGLGKRISVAEGPRSVSVTVPALANVAAYDITLMSSKTGEVVASQSTAAGVVTIEALDPAEVYSVSVEATFADGARSQGLFFAQAQPRLLGPKVKAVAKGSKAAKSSKVTVSFTVAASMRKTCTGRPAKCVRATAKIQLLRGTKWVTTSVKVPTNGRITVTLKRDRATAVRVAIGRAMSATRQLG